jgi:hypothetical protein
MAKIIKCVNCKHTIPAGSKECPYCDADTIQSMIAPEAPQPLDGRCERCGSNTGRRLQYLREDGKTKYYRYFCYICHKLEKLGGKSGVAYNPQADLWDQAAWLEAAAREYYITEPVFYGRTPNIEAMDKIYNKTVSMKERFVNQQRGK